jgi:hypothetical protein
MSDYVLPTGANPDCIEASIFRRQAQIMSQVRKVEGMIDRFADMLERRGVFAQGDAHYVKTGEEPIEGFEDAKWGHAEKLLELTRGQ